jgi:hypothetical protein
MLLKMIPAFTVVFGIILGETVSSAYLQISETSSPLADVRLFFVTDVSLFFVTVTVLLSLVIF